MKLTLTIPGEPVAKGRPRFYNGHAITPAKTVNYETLVKEMWAVTHGQQMLDGELCASLTAYFAIPGSKSKAMKKRMSEGIVRPTKKPDIDNLIKSALDSLNGIAYKDDSQIVTVVASKFYSDTPRLELEIWERPKEDLFQPSKYTDSAY